MQRRRSVVFGRRVVAAAEGADALLITPQDWLTADTLSGLSSAVRAIATFSVGFEHIDLRAAAARGIVVTNTPDVLTDATANLTMLLLLGRARPFGSRRTAPFAASTFAAVHLTGRLIQDRRLLVASPGPTERSGSARTGLSPVRSHALPSLLARSPGGGASYGGDPVLKRPTMLQPGDIVVERVTGNRAIVIRVVSPEETICRFGDGRFEERFTFELELPPSPLVSFLSFSVSSFLSWFRQSPAASVPERSRAARARFRASS